MPESDDSLLGRSIAGKFLVEQFLGGGAMGSVYRACQVALDKSVAVKVLHREMARDPAFVGRFHHEAKHASKLDHPNSVRVLDFGEEPDGLLYIVMEYLNGRDLLQVMNEEWPLDDRRVAIILSQVLAALAVAHDQGIIHRDLKPENIMVLPGTTDDGDAIDLVKVCDFGIATIAGAVEEDARGGRLTAKGLVMGTPDYMSPEQARGEKLDPRTDIYSIGVVLYHLLTGKTPFIAESALGIALRHVTDPVTPPSQVREEVDPGLERICLRALEKSRDARFASARQMRSELRSVLEARGKSLPKIPVAPTASGGAPSAGSGPHSAPGSTRPAGTVGFEKRAATVGYEAPPSSFPSPSGAPPSRAVRSSIPGSPGPTSHRDTMAFSAGPSSTPENDAPGSRAPVAPKKTSPLLISQRPPIHDRKAATVAAPAVAPSRSEPPKPLFASDRPVHDRNADTDPPPSAESAASGQRQPVSIPPPPRAPQVTFEQLNSNEIQVMVDEEKSAGAPVAEAPPAKRGRGSVLFLAAAACVALVGAGMYLKQQQEAPAPAIAPIDPPAPIETATAKEPEPEPAPSSDPEPSPSTEAPAAPSSASAGPETPTKAGKASKQPIAKVIATSKVAATGKPVAETAPMPTPSVVEPPPPAPTPASTPTPTAAIAPPPPPPMPAVAAPVKPDPATASVGIGNVTVTNGLSSSSVRNAINHAPFQKCYRDAVAASSGPLTGTGSLRLSIAETGHIVGASFGGAFPAAMKGCIEAAARAVTVKNVDTGEATANVTLSFTHK